MPMQITPLLLLSFLYHIHTHEMLNIPTEIDGPSANQPSTNVSERKSLKRLLSNRRNLIHTFSGNTTNNKTRGKQRKKIDEGNQGNKQYNYLEIHKDKRSSLISSQSSRLPEIEYNRQWTTPQQITKEENNTGIFSRNQTSKFYKCLLVNFSISEKLDRCQKYHRRRRRGQADLYSYDEDYYDEDLLDYDEKALPPTLAKRLLLNWDKVILKVIFLLSALIMACSCCCCFCRKCCVQICRTYKSCCQGCADKLCCRDEQYSNMRDMATKFGLELDYETYKKFKKSSEGLREEQMGSRF